MWAGERQGKMSKLSINLSHKHRIDIRLVKRLGAPDPLLSELKKLGSIRRGNKLSRLFRFLFNKPQTKRVFGAILILLVIASSLGSPVIATDAGNINDVVVKTPAPVITTQKAIQIPLTTTRINQGYSFFHPAIDLHGDIGDSVYPIKDGVVKSTNYTRQSYGNYVVVQHNDGSLSLYAHLSAITVEADQKVDMYTKLGEVGSTGRSTGPHLHLEIWGENGVHINPLSVLPPIE